MKLVLRILLIGSILFSSFSIGQADTTVGGTISTDTTWTVADSPYIVTSNITVKGTDGADGITTLTIEPGVVVKLNSSRYIIIGASSGDPGALSAVGTAADPITFTSNQASPAPGDWYYIQFYNTTDDTTTVMEHCVVEYGGYSGGSLYAYQASPTFRNVTVKDSKTYGLNLYSSESTIENCTFSGNQNYDLYYTGTVGGSVTGSTINSGISLLATGAVNFSGNTINQNNALPIKAYADNVGEISASTFTNVDAASYMEVAGQTVTRDATWTDAIPYAVTSNMTVKGTDGVDGITTLTIEPGAVVKVNPYRQIAVGASSGDPGALSAVGTLASPITFTSNQASPASGDWYYIYFQDTTDDATTVMEHCVVEYGGYSSGMLYLYNASPKIQNNTIRYSKTAGIYASGSGTSQTVVECNTFSGNQYGIRWLVSAPPEMHHNNFSSNSTNGLYYSGSQTMNAEDNWWNDTAGPNAGGDAIYGNVDADPWSTAPNQCSGSAQNYPPNPPSDPLPADGAVHIVTDPSIALTWSGSDPNSEDTLTYDLYWGTSADSLSLVAQDITDATYSMTGLAGGVSYYWQIIAKDNGGLEASGPVWSFTSEGDPPDLIVTGITITPAGGLPPNSWVTLTAEITNNGSGPVVDDFVTEFIVDDSAIGTVNTESFLASGISIQLSKDWYYTGGDHEISVVTDSSGTVSETDESNNELSVLLSAVADITAPSVVGISPSSGAFLQQIEQVSFTLNDNQSSVDDAAVIASFSLTNSVQQNIGGTITEDSDTFTFVPSSLPLADDTYQISFTAADTYGNSQAITLDFTIDTVPPAKPTITGSTVASGTIQPRPAQNTADRVIAVLEGTRDPETTLWINGMQFVHEGSGTWSTHINLAPGDNALEVYCLDAAGNQSPSEWVDINVTAEGGTVYQYDSSGRMIRVTNN
jgi:hypothetical protein